MNSHSKIDLSKDSNARFILHKIIGLNAKNLFSCYFSISNISDTEIINLLLTDPDPFISSEAKKG